MDDFDCTAGDGFVELTLYGRDLCLTLSVDEAERIGCALLRAAGVADWKSTDCEEVGPSVFVMDNGDLPF